MLSVFLHKWLKLGHSYLGAGVTKKLSTDSIDIGLAASKRRSIDHFLKFTKLFGLARWDILHSNVDTLECVTFAYVPIDVLAKYNGNYIV